MRIGSVAHSVCCMAGRPGDAAHLFIIIVGVAHARALQVEARTAARRRRLRQYKLMLLRAYLQCFDSAGRFLPRSLFLSRVWFHDSLMHMHSDHFKQQLRMHRRSFDVLVQRLSPHLEIHYDGPGRRPLTVAMQTALFLYRAAHNSSCNVVSQQFGVAASSVSRVCGRVARAVPIGLADQLVFPPHREFREEIVPGFNQCSDIRDIGLVIDGCLVNLATAPPWWADPKSYISRKMRFAMHLLAAVDHRRRFRDITVGYPGCAHDNRVLRNSDLFRHARELLPPRCALLCRFPLSLSVCPFCAR